MTQLYNSSKHKLLIKQKHCFVSIAIVLLSALSFSGFGQTVIGPPVTYTWNGGTASWTESSSWIPNGIPADNDIVDIRNGGTVTLTNIPAQAISRLIIGNNTHVILQAGAANTLTINNGAGVDLSVEAGSTLEINTNIPLNIKLAASATATIMGNIIFTGSSNAATHTLDATTTGSIVFGNGSVFTQNSVGHAFTSSGTSETVIFNSGSTFISQNGANPFGTSISTVSKVKFNTGSLFSHRQTSPEPSLSGRTYANFEINAPGYSQTSTGTNGFTVDNFTIKNAATVNINISGNINIKGNLTVDAGNVNLNPGSPGTLTFNGAINQTIGGSGGTLAFGSNTTVSVPLLNTLVVERSLTTSGGVTVNGTLRYGAGSAISLTIGGNLTATGTIDMSAGNQAHVLNLAGATNTLTTLVNPAGCNTTIHYNRNGNQTVASSANYSNLTISGSGEKTLAGAITVCRDLTVNTGATLLLGGFDATVNANTSIAGTLNAGLTAVAGIGSFTITGTGTLITASPEGIALGTTSGSIRVSGTRVLDPGSFVYNGTVPQVTGNGLPATVNNMTIANTAATPTVALSQSVNVSGAARFSSGTLAIGSYTLTLSGTTSLGSGTITGGAGSNLSIGGTSTATMLLPSIAGGLRNLTLDKTGTTPTVTLPASGVTIYHGGTLTLTNGSITNGQLLTMGESTTAITNIRRSAGSLAGSAPTFNNLVNVTYLQSVTTGTELPSSVSALNNLTINASNITVTLNTDASPVVNGTFQLLTGAPTTGLNLNGRTFTLNGNYDSNQIYNGVFIGSSTSSIVINGNNKTVNGSIRLSQATAESRRLQNLTINRTGTGSNFVISTYAEINNLNIISGTLTADRFYTSAPLYPDISITTADIGANGKFINNSLAFPSILPTSTTMRAFNNNSLGNAFTNKFDRYAASNDAGNFVTNNATDLIFNRNGAGSVYAFRNKIFSPVLNTALVRFRLGVSTTTAANAAGTLMIGNNLGDDASTPAATARLQFNLITTGSGITVTSPDGTSYTSGTGLNLEQPFTWVINNSGASITYTGPDGNNYNLNTGRCALWHNNQSLFLDRQIQNTGQAMSQMKFVMDGGNGTIRLRDLKINPLARITTTTLACFTAGYTLNVEYTATYPGTSTPAAASFNEGNEFRVQLSNSSGNFDNNSLIIGGNLIKSTAATGTVQALIPAFYMGTGYRYRVISTDLAINVGTDNVASMYFTSPGLSQSILPSGTGNMLTANATAATAYQWGYRTTSGSGFTAIPGATSATYTPVGAHLGSGNPGTYYVVCRINLPGCTGAITNEVIVYINCETGPVNFITNGRFDNTLRGTITAATNSVTVNGTGTSFLTQLRVGRSLYRSPDNALIGTIASITSDTQLTLTTNPLNAVTSSAYSVSYYQLQMVGTITITPSGNNNHISRRTVNGTNTRFLEQIKPGDLILRHESWGSVLLGTVSTVTSNTVLTLTANATEAVSGIKFRTNANAALYTGTITTNTANNTVTGTGTKFNTEIRVGDLIKDQNNNLIGTVAAISSTTSLTLTSNCALALTGQPFSSNPASFGNSGLGFNTTYAYGTNANNTNWPNTSEKYPFNPQDTDQGSYSIGTDPGYFEPDFCNIPPTPTSASGGNMLIADADPSNTKILWSQTITGLTPGTNYVLTFNANSLYNPTPTTNSLVFGMYLNCNRVGEDITAGFTGECKWAKYSIQVNSGTLTSFELAIANISANGNGNDIAIDDIQFYECSAVLAVPFAPANEFRWRGFTTNWFNSDNWGVCPGILPTCGDDVEIPANAPNYPIINADNAVARTVKINAGGSITINADRNLNVCGDIINNGALNNLASATNAAHVTFISYGAATLPPSPIPTRQSVSGNSPFTNFVINQNPVLSGGVRLENDATINTRLDIHKNNTLDLNGKQLTLIGNINSIGDKGTITGSSTSKLVVNGTGNAGALRFTSGSRTLASLTMARASAGSITLGTDLMLVGGSNALTLTNGIINTSNTQILRLDLNSGVTGSSLRKSGGSPVSYVEGPLAKTFDRTVTSFTFPVGNNGLLGEIGMDPTIASNDNSTTTFIAQYFRISAYTRGNSTISNYVVSPLQHVSRLEHWTMDREAGNAPGSVTLHWTGNSDVGITDAERSNLRVARFNGVSWESRGPEIGAIGGNYSSGYVTSNSISAFSPFSLASTTAANPLPIELLDLKAKSDNKVVHINWITNTEHNSSHFILQRSVDGVNFTSIARIKAAGESRTIRNYLHTDMQPVTNLNYYRLQQVDNDGITVTSKIVSAIITSAIESRFEVYPNPSEGKLLHLQLNYKGEIIVSVFTMTGVEIVNQRAMATGGITTIQPKNGLVSGMYVVRVITPENTYQQKLLVK